MVEGALRTTLTMIRVRTGLSQKLTQKRVAQCQTFEVGRIAFSEGVTCDYKQETKELHLTGEDPGAGCERERLPTIWPHLDPMGLVQ